MYQQQDTVSVFAEPGAGIHGLEELRRVCQCQDRLLTMVAHDLKSPLNVILGVGESLRAGLSDPSAEMDKAEILHDVNTILSMGNGMVRLVEGLLCAARLESGKEDLELVEIADLGEVLQSIGGIYRSKAQGRGIALTVELDDPLPAVYWDMCRIQYHVLNNILSNALKYAGEGGCVRLSARVDDAAVLIAVADDGPGIPVEERGKVFDRFERLGVKAERAYQSSGLGLYNAYLLTRQHGGTIRIDDGIGGRGVAFTVTLPARPSLPQGVRLAG